MKPFTRKGKQDFFCKDTYNRWKILFSMIQKTFSRSQKAENVIKSKILDTIKERTHVNILYLCGENANELHENLFSNCRLRLFFNRIMNKKLIFGTNIRGAQYPQITTDHRGVFQLRAPQAQEVIVDIGGKKYPMSKNAEGIWTATTDPRHSTAAVGWLRASKCLTTTTTGSSLPK